MIITNYKQILLELIQNYNNIYKTDFILKEYVKDEVNYALINYVETNSNDIFNLGYQFGIHINQLRNTDKIKD